jgi:hypothetical protein
MKSTRVSTKKASNSISIYGPRSSRHTGPTVHPRQAKRGNRPAEAEQDVPARKYPQNPHNHCQDHPQSRLRVVGSYTKINTTWFQKSIEVRLGTRILKKMLRSSARLLSFRVGVDTQCRFELFLLFGNRDEGGGVLCGSRGPVKATPGAVFALDLVYYVILS